MLLPVHRLVDRVRYGKGRAAELAAVRARLAALPGPDEAPAEQVAQARELRRLRVELTAALEGVTSCSGCARGRALPEGHWDGGFCCGGRTEAILSDDELAAMRLGGTTTSDLVPPRGDLAGCVFRGPTGCSLEVADRPTLCVRFLCLELERELGRRGDLAAVRAIAGQLARGFRQLMRLRSGEGAVRSHSP